MRLIVLLSWYDEHPSWLENAILSLKPLDVDHIVALDGAYALYPDGKAESSQEEYEAIRQAGHEIGAVVDTYTPPNVWHGNEIEKRNYLFRLGWEHVLAGGEVETIPWFMVFDADEAVKRAPDNVKDRLGASPFDVGAVTLNEPGHPMGTVTFATFPMFFRAQPIEVRGAHFRYFAQDGRQLWGDAIRDQLEPRADLTDVVIEHRKLFRATDRKKAATTYYENRDASGVEDLPAERMLIS
jgi:hypothetical protein